MVSFHADFNDWTLYLSIDISNTHQVSIFTLRNGPLWVIYTCIELPVSSKTNSFDFRHLLKVVDQSAYMFHWLHYFNKYSPYLVDIYLPIYCRLMYVSRFEPKVFHQW